jgi:PAS domain S-box-containing protein
VGVDAAALEGDLFEALVQGVREYAIFMLSPDGTVATWNPGAERIKGYRAEEIVGRHFSVFFPPEDARAGRPAQELEAAVAHGSHAEEGWRLRKDGSRFFASVVVTALSTPGGRLRGFAKVTRDLTEARRAEEARKNLVEAREAVRARDDFLAIASHELRTPLTGLRLLVQSALREPRAGGFQVEPLLERLRGLDRYVTRLERLVNGLLDLTTLASGRLRLDPTPLDLAELVRGEVALRADEAAERGGGLVLEVSEPLPGRWDRDRLREALAAVLGNAVKYGGKARIDVRARRDGRFAAVEVEDHGPGIAPEDQARVFERFERAVPVTHYGGFGIGLWAARQIVAAHGGEIDIRSAPGQGSVFTIRLPLPDEVLSPVLPFQPAHPGRG